MLDDIGLSLMMLDDAIGVHEKMAFRANVQKKMMAFESVGLPECAMLA